MECHGNFWGHPEQEVRTGPTRHGSTRHAVLIKWLVLPPAALLLISGWLQIPVWHVSDLIDASWLYALTRMRLDGVYLGKEVFFTYGPLAQHLGPLIFNGQTPTLLYFVVGAVYVIVMSACLNEFLEMVSRDNWWGLPFIGGFLVALAALAFEVDKLDISYSCLTTIVYLLVFLREQEGRANLFLFLLFVLAILGMHIKFSLGLYAALLLVLAVIARRQLRLAILLTGAFVIANYVVFFSLSGSLAFHDFFLQGLVCSSRYSEIMPVHNSSELSDSSYVWGLGFCINFVVAVYVLTRTAAVKGASRVLLLLGVGLGTFLLFKMGFVRADKYHVVIPYLALLPVLMLVYSVTVPKALTSRAHIFLLAFGFLIAALAYDDTAWINGSDTEGNFRQLLTRWVDTPARLARGIRLLRTGFADETENSSALSGRTADLIRRACGERLGGNVRNPSLGIAPFELMYSHLVPESKWLPIPSLQLYVEPLLLRGDALTRRYLTANTGPQMLMLSSFTVDGSNSLSDFSAWLEPLYRNYTFLDATREHIVVQHLEMPREKKLIFRNEGPGLFLRARVDPQDFFRASLFRLASIFFKAPELEAIIRFRDRGGRERVIRSRGYYSLCVQGRLFGQNSLPSLLPILYGVRSPRADEIIDVVLSARLVRKDGGHNLAVFPPSVPMRIEFGSVEGFERTLEAKSERRSEPLDPRTKFGR
jgi:hypothetical protein